MTTNPFSDIAWTQLKTLHNQGIDSIITNMAVTCTAIYPAKRTDCINCIFNSVTGKSSNKYQSGGPIPFTSGSCPYCLGKGLIDVEPSESISLVILWEPNSWFPLPSGFDVKIQTGLVQTWSFKATYPKIKQAKEVILDTSLNTMHKHRYTREGEPWWCGLGENRYCVSMWRESGSGG